MRSRIIAVYPSPGCLSLTSVLWWEAPSSMLSSTSLTLFSRLSGATLRDAVELVLHAANVFLTTVDVSLIWSEMMLMLLLTSRVFLIVMLLGIVKFFAIVQGYLSVVNLFCFSIDYVHISFVWDSPR